MAKPESKVEQRRQQLEAASKHVIKGELGSGPHDPDEHLLCSCGWRSPECVVWYDDVVQTDLKRWKHAENFILVYSPGHEMATGGVVLVVAGGKAKRLSSRELRWASREPRVSQALRDAVDAYLG